MTEMNIGITKCPACRGTGLITQEVAEISYDCPTCRGTGQIDRTAPGFLESGATTYRERNKQYGDSYYKFGKVMAELFPDGFIFAGANSLDPKKAAHDWNRLGILVQIVSKLTRYSNDFSKPHHDSIHDIMVYAAMLQELDQDE